MKDAEYQWASTEMVIEIANALAWRAAVTTFFAAAGLASAVTVILLQSMPETFDWVGVISFAVLIASCVYGFVYWVKGISVVNLVAPFLVPDTRPAAAADEKDEEVDDVPEVARDNGAISGRQVVPPATRPEPLSDFVKVRDGMWEKRDSAPGVPYATGMTPPHPSTLTPRRVGPPRVAGVRPVAADGGVGEVDESDILDF